LTRNADIEWLIRCVEANGLKLIHPPRRRIYNSIRARAMEILQEGHRVVQSEIAGKWRAGRTRLYKHTHFSKTVMIPPLALV
jgi:hypothetical protein